jgi:hypothetical protein
MAFDVSQSVAELQSSFTQWLTGIFGDESKALAFAQDPYGELEDGGFTNQNLANLNVQQAVAEACTSPGVPSYVQENLSGYSGPGYAGPPTIEHVVEQVQQVTQIVYQDNDVITTEIQNNTSNVTVGDNFSGELDVDQNNADDGAIANSGDNSGQQNTGDDVIQNQGNIEGSAVTGGNSGVVQGANSSAENVVTGTGNTVGAQIQDVSGSVEDLQFATGVSGNVAQTNDSTGTATSAGGDAVNINESTLEGVGLSTGSGASSGSFEDNDDNSTTTTSDDDVTTTTNNTDSFNNDNDNETNTSTVTNSDNTTTEQGPGDQTDGTDNEADALAL